MSHVENKDLAAVLSDYLMIQGAKLPNNQEIVTCGVYPDPMVSRSSRHGLQPQLSSNHEEADTRIILHGKDAIDRGFNRILVDCRDSDVLLLLVHFFGHLLVEVWMLSGTKRQRKCFPVNKIAASMPSPVIKNLLGYHALTGCDSNSS